VSERLARAEDNTNYEKDADCSENDFPGQKNLQTRLGMMIDELMSGDYQSDPIANSGREGRKDGKSGVEPPCRRLRLAMDEASNFVLLVRNVVGILAILQICGERMRQKVFSQYLFKASQKLV
jgi:hypothetical protein